MMVLWRVGILVVEVWKGLIFPSYWMNVPSTCMNYSKDIMEMNKSPIIVINFKKTIKSEVPPWYASLRGVPRWDLLVQRNHKRDNKAKQVISPTSPEFRCHAPLYPNTAYQCS